MIVRDFHGCKLEDVGGQVDMMIGYFRGRKMVGDVEFITGRGPIRAEVFKVLEQYGIEGKLKLGNDGVIVAVIE